MAPTVQKRGCGKFPGHRVGTTKRPTRTCGNPEFAVHRCAADPPILDEWSRTRKLSCPAGLGRTQMRLGFSENCPVVKDFFLLFPAWMFLMDMKGVPAGFPLCAWLSPSTPVTCQASRTADRRRAGREDRHLLEGACAPRGSWVLDTNVGSKLFVTLGFVLLHHFIQ